MDRPVTRLPAASERSGWSRRARTLARWIGLHDREFAAAIVVIGLGVFVVLELGVYVRTEEANAFDRAVLMAMRSPAGIDDPIGPRWFEEMGRDVTALGGVLVVGSVAFSSIAYALLRRARATAALLFVSIGGGFVLSLALKSLYARPRPDLVSHGSIVYTQSFPSGHSMLAATTYLTIAAILVQLQPRRRLKAFVLAVAVVATLSVGASRVYLGVHWPSDVLAGWAAGAAWAALVWYVARRVQANTRESAAVEPE